MNNKIPDIYISKNIEFLRKSKKMTQDELGKLMKKDYSTIGKWEKNINQPSIEDTFKLSMIFNVDWKDFVLSDLSTKADNKSTKTTSNNEIQIIIDKDKPITAETIVEVQQTLMDEMKKNKQ